MEKLSISQLADDLDVSTRIIRYYEELQALRGKRIRFSLVQIKEMIDLFKEDRTGKKQLERTIEYGNQKLTEIDEQKKELTLLREEIMTYKEKFEEKLRVLKT